MSAINDDTVEFKEDKTVKKYTLNLRKFLLNSLLLKGGEYASMQILKYWLLLIVDYAKDIPGERKSEHDMVI